jgi:hypothetical protein
MILVSRELPGGFSMSKTAVGLFQNPSVADQVVQDLDASEIRILGEPREMSGDGLMSTPRTDFEVGLNRELRAIGASNEEANAYVQGVRRGGVLVFATGSNMRVDTAAEIMNRHDAIAVDELVGSALDTDSLASAPMTRIQDSSSQNGRISQAGGGARMFVW